MNNKKTKDITREAKEFRAPGGGSELRDKFEKESKGKLIEMLIEAYQELQRVGVENKQLKQQVEKLMQENWELRFDELTGLERRLVYFTKVNSQIEQTIGQESVREILEGDTLSSDDLEKLKMVPLSVTSLDLGYLSKYNEDKEITQHYGGGHGGGDEMMRQTGALIQEIRPEGQEVKPKLKMETSGFRLGGDEVGMIHQLTKEEAKRVVQEFKLKHAEIKIAGADLPPVINDGTADFSEAVEAFVGVISKNERTEMDTEAKYKKLQEFMTNIADRRAKRAKAYERIIQMTDLFKNEPAKFERNFSYLQKGALRLEKEDFEELSQLQKRDSEGFRQEVRRRINQALETEHKDKISKQIQEHQVIVKIADREVLAS